MQDLEPQLSAFCKAFGLNQALMTLDYWINVNHQFIRWVDQQSMVPSGTFDVKTKYEMWLNLAQHYQIVFRTELALTQYPVTRFR